MNARRTTSPAALDDLPAERLEIALMMLAFLRAVWRADAGRKWWFWPGGEHEQAIRDLAACGKLTIVRDLEGFHYARRKVA